VLIIEESYVGAFLLILLLQFYPCYYLALLFYSCTYWVPTISVLNLAIFPYYSNLLLRRRGWTGIPWWGVLGYVLPRLSFLRCYGVFRCSVPLRIIIVFRDTIYVIIILYSRYLVICEHFWPYVWNNWSWVIHMMSTWFSHKTGYDTCLSRTDVHYLVDRHLVKPPDPTLATTHFSSDENGTAADALPSHCRPAPPCHHAVKTLPGRCASPLSCSRKLCGSTPAADELAVCTPSGAQCMARARSHAASKLAWLAWPYAWAGAVPWPASLMDCATYQLAQLS
jgi:hypothetical protein